MNSLNLDILPGKARKELKDFYEFLVSKYNNKHVRKTRAKKVRPYALAKGELNVPDTFNDPLPDDLLNEFYK